MRMSLARSQSADSENFQLNFALARRANRAYRRNLQLEAWDKCNKIPMRKVSLRGVDTSMDDDNGPGHLPPVQHIYMPLFAGYFKFKLWGQALAARPQNQVPRLAHQSMPRRVGSARPAPPVADSDSSVFMTDEDSDHDLGGMQKTAYFCCRCAQKAPCNAAGARPVHFFDSPVAVRNHINRNPQCCGGAYGEVQRVVRATDVAAGGGSKSRNRRNEAEDSMQQQERVIQPGNALNIVSTLCYHHVITKWSCSHGIAAMSKQC